MRYIRLVKNVSNWWVHFGIKAGLVHRDPVLFRLPNRIRLEVPARLMHEFKEIFLEECYSAGLIRPVASAPCVVDVGANVGFFSLFAASRYSGARVFAYEPIPLNFTQLQRNAQINPHVQMACHQAAVFRSSGQIELSFESGNGFTTAASIFSHPASRSQILTVPCIGLEELLDNNGIERCHLLKMDCEGAEFETIYGCSEAALRRIDQMAIEVHRGQGHDQNINALARFLGTKGFQTRRLGDILYAAGRS